MKLMSLGAALLVMVLAVNAQPMWGSGQSLGHPVVAVRLPFCAAVLDNITYSRNAARVSASLDDFTPDLQADNSASTAMIQQPCWVRLID